MTDIPSLSTLILNQITKDPELSLELLNDNALLMLPSTFQSYLLKHAPFINLLPIELYVQIVLLLPIDSWSSLFRTSTQWQRAVTAAANIYLNAETKHLEDLSNYDFDHLTQELSEAIKKYKVNANSYNHQRAQQIEKLENLINKVNHAPNVLMKLFHLQHGLQGIQKEISNEYHFFSPRNSFLYQLVSSVYQHLPTEYYTNKAIQCLKFSPQHPLNKILTNVSSEKKVSMEKDQTLMMR